jgi:hypothetical protein
VRGAPSETRSFWALIGRDAKRRYLAVVVADMEGPAVKRLVRAPSISSSMLMSEHYAVEQG